jgi:hypothetical protein
MIEMKKIILLKNKNPGLGRGFFAFEEVDASFISCAENTRP